MTADTLATAFEMFGEEYGVTLTPAKAELWLMVFEDATDDEFRHALKAFLQTADAKWMPKAGQVYAFITKNRQQAQIEGIPTVADALLEVRGTLNRYEGQPIYSHPIIAKAVATIGYYRLCEMTSEDISREFRVTYGELRKHILDKPIEEWPMVEGRRSGMGSIGDSLRSLPGLLGGCK